MRHVVKALKKFNSEQPEGSKAAEFIMIENSEDLKGVAPNVCFKIQSDPIGEVGVNGCQAADMLHYVKCLFESLNETHPCSENQVTIKKIMEAMHWQNIRTKDRVKRNVEGENKA